MGLWGRGERIYITFPVLEEAGVLTVRLCLRGGDNEEKPVYTLEKGELIDGCRRFTLCFDAPSPGIYYYRFEADTKDGVLFLGAAKDHKTEQGNFLPEWQLTVFDPAFKTPEWMGDGVIYQIFPDRFCKAGEEKPFTKKGVLHENWYDPPVTRDEKGNYYADDFFGGNIEGIIEKLPYLKSLGVKVIYLNPIFASASNHRYDTGDYLKIDPLFGTKEEFRALLDQAHEMGMRIMLDGVFSHTGADSVYFNKFGTYDSVGAYQSKNSPYYKWYTFTHYPDEYECWWGVTVVPNVKETEESYLSFITGEGGVLDTWGKFGVDAWRLDVADELPDAFLFALRDRVKKTNPDAFILGEVWENASNKTSYGVLRPYLLGRQLDSVMNYPFKEGILSYIKGGNAAALNDKIWDVLETYPPESIKSLMNHIGTHDTRRILTELGEDKRLVKVASAIQFFLPGVPSIYYGDEAGLTGEGDPLNRACFPWGREDEDLIAHYRMLAFIREENAAILRTGMREGGFRVLTMDGPLFAFERRGETGALVIICNVSGGEETFYVDGVGRVTLPEKSFRIFKIYQ